ncbi:hypothetical protein FALBO_3266 [Fusarium albosuccineum]|uniref:Uncharacterized protein n=1 Tax=Fusarium albosuccineum TaxID=1237068 RepID=A0A8H4LIN0_9HYPO|nr:hypothetical protein FALBO_3266 [Fusarium albosuccineum]
MCHQPQEIFDVCGHHKPLSQQEIPAEEQLWLVPHGDSLLRRCPLAANAGGVCAPEAIEDLPILSVNKNTKCPECAGSFMEKLGDKILSFVLMFCNDMSDYPHIKSTQFPLESDIFLYSPTQQKSYDSLGHRHPQRLRPEGIDGGSPREELATPFLHQGSHIAKEVCGDRRRRKSREVVMT